MSAATVSATEAARSFPPLTDIQVERIVALLRPSTVAKPEAVKR